MSPLVSGPDHRYLAELRRRTLDALGPVLGRERDVVLLGTPRHRNLGDALIWAGGLGYLESLGNRVVHHGDSGRYRDEHSKTFPADAILVLHGGGNLGDRYPSEEGFRRHVVRTLGHREIVVLPQTMGYRDPAAERAAYADYRSADHLTIFLRDEPSLTKARTRMPDVRWSYCPDVAFGAPITPTGPSAGGRVAVVARNDDERAEGDVNVTSESDWQISRPNQIVWQVAMAIGRIERRLPSPRRPSAAVRAANRVLLELNVGAARHQYDGAAAVATNRLHAHVLACLLGIPHFVADTADGKVAPIFREYSGGFSTAHFAESLSAAIRSAALLAGERLKES